MRPRPHLWILDEAGEPVAVEDENSLTWSRWLSSNRQQRVVAQTQVRDMWISTVFLGIDHNFSFEGPAILFETMIFGGRGVDGEQWRYATRAQALEGHELALELARATKPFDLGRNVVHMYGFRLVRRYTANKKRWAVFNGTSRAPIASVIKLDAPDEHWQLVVASTAAADNRSRYISELIRDLDRDLGRERAEKIMADMGLRS